MMKFFAWLGMTVISAFFIWFAWFGVIFVYDDASARKAAFGFAANGSGPAATIVFPILLSVIAAVVAVFIADTEVD